MLIPDMLQTLFGYRHYAHGKCPTSLVFGVFDDTPENAQFLIVGRHATFVVNESLGI